MAEVSLDVNIRDLSGGGGYIPHPHSLMSHAYDYIEANSCSAAGSSLHQKNEERVWSERLQASLRSMPALPERKKESIQRD